MRAAPVLLCLVAVVPSTAVVMQLHMMPDKGLTSMGAVCLDGSDAGFYFAAATDPMNVNDWQIYFDGGGWCYDERDCWGRSFTRLGSSTAQPWAPTMAVNGIMSDNCLTNPDFCNFNRVHMAYCDGNSFSGNREDPVTVIGADGKPKQLYFRGKRILDATLQTLLTLGLDKAQRVLLTGCSAGGLATYLHADYVYEWLMNAKVPVQRYGAVPVSGFFLSHQNVMGVLAYTLEMKNLFEMSQAITGVNQRCVAALGAQAWACNFAQFSYLYTQVPIFALNSNLDSFSIPCIYAGGLAPGFPNQTVLDSGECNSVPAFACSKNPEQCTEEGIALLNQWIVDFGTTIMINAAGTYQKPGNGAFLHSCFTHCAAILDSSWNKFKVMGISMREAVSAWWNSVGQPAALHSYNDACVYSAATKPRGCNPTCYTIDGEPAQDPLFALPDKVRKPQESPREIIF